MTEQLKNKHSREGDGSLWTQEIEFGGEIFFPPFRKESHILKYPHFSELVDHAHQEMCFYHVNYIAYRFSEFSHQQVAPGWKGFPEWGTSLPSLGGDAQWGRNLDSLVQNSQGLWKQLSKGNAREPGATQRTQRPYLGAGSPRWALGVSKSPQLSTEPVAGEARWWAEVGSVIHGAPLPFWPVSLVGTVCWTVKKTGLCAHPWAAGDGSSFRCGPLPGSLSLEPKLSD